MVCCIAVCVWYLLAACGIVCVAAAPAPIHPPGEAEGWPAAAAARETESLCYPGGGGGGGVVVVVWCGGAASCYQTGEMCRTGPAAPRDLLKLHSSHLTLLPRPHCSSGHPPDNNNTFQLR